MDIDSQADSAVHSPPGGAPHDSHPEHPDEETPMGEWRPSLLLLGPLMAFSVVGWLALAWVLSIIPEWQNWVAGAGNMAFGDASPSPGTWRIIALLVMFLVMFAPVFVRIAQVLSTQYVVTSQRLHYYRGIINRYQDQIEIVRIRDLSVVKPLTLRLFGYGHIVLHTEDRVLAMLQVMAVRDPEQFKDMLHRLSLGERNRVGYREYEVT